MDRRVFLPACAALCAVALSAFASEGNQLLGTGPIQEGLAGAGVATSHDATWAILNPAGLVYLEPRFDAYVTLLTLTREIEIEGPFGFVSNKYAGEMKDTRPIVFPSFALAWRAPVGMFATGIMGLEGDEVDFPYSRSTLGRLRNEDRRSSLETAAIPFAYAREIGGGWAVGGAAMLEFSRLRSDSLTLRLRPTRGDYHWDEALGYGFMGGVSWRGEQWGFGAAYRTRQRFEHFNLYRDLTQYPIDVPPQFQAGVSYRPIPALELLLDYRYIAWTKVPQFGNKTIPKGGLQWDDQHIAKIAANWQMNDDWALRGGLSYGKSPLDKKVIFTNAHFPATVELHATVGLTRRLNERSDLHFSYDHAFSKEMTDSGTGDLFSRLGKGTRSRMEQDFFTVGYTYKF